MLLPFLCLLFCMHELFNKKLLVIKYISHQFMAQWNNKIKDFKLRVTQSE